MVGRRTRCCPGGRAPRSRRAPRPRRSRPPGRAPPGHRSHPAGAGAARPRPTARGEAARPPWMGPRPEPPPHASRPRSRKRPRPRGGGRPLRFPTPPHPRRSSPCSRSLPVLPASRLPEWSAGRAQGDPRPAGLRRDLPASSPVALSFAAPAATLHPALPLEPLLTLTAAHLPHPAPRLDVDLLAPQIRLDLLRLLDRALAHHQLFLHPRTLLDDQLLLGHRDADLLLADLAATVPHRPPLDLDFLDVPRHRATHVLRPHMLRDVHLARFHFTPADRELLLGPGQVRLSFFRPATMSARVTLRGRARLPGPLFPRHPAGEEAEDPVLRVAPQRQPLERRQP